MTKRELMIAGAMLYACEGTKKRRDKRYKNYYIYAIELTNSNPKIIKLFSEFLSKILYIDWRRVRGQLFIYPDHDEKKLKRFWSEASHIPLSQFQQVIRLKQKNSKYSPNPHGTFKIRYNNKVDFIKLQKIIENVFGGVA